MRSTNVGRIKFVNSTVDETLFGELTKAREPVRVPAFEPPWVEGGKANTKTQSKPLLFYCPGSSTPPASSHSQRSSLVRAYKPVQFSPAYVDESLFGNRRTKRSNSPPPSEFDPPWVKGSEEKRDRPILFDCNSRLFFDDSCEFDASRRPMSSRSRTPRSPRSHSSSRATSRAQSIEHIPKSANKPPWR